MPKTRNFYSLVSEKNLKMCQNGGFSPIPDPPKKNSKIGLSGAHSFILALLRAKNLSFPAAGSTLTGNGVTN